MNSRNVYAAFLFIATGGLLFGYSIGINGNMVTKGQLLCPDDWNGPVGSLSSVGYGQCYKLDVWSQGFLSSLTLIGATVSSAVCFGYADLLGRKLEVQIGAVLYFLGSVVAACAPMLWAIYLGFLIYGLGIGFAMHAAPVYIAEISPAEVRGTLVAAKELVIVLGMVLGYATGAIFADWHQTGWRLMGACSAAFALVMGVGTSYIPNSPRWLVLRSATPSVADADSCSETSPLLPSGVGAAKEALRWFRVEIAEDKVDAEYEAMCKDTLETLKTASQTGAIGWRALCQFPRPMIVGCGLVFLQQITGQPAVLYFATDIFKNAGFASTAAVSSLSIGLVKLLATLLTVWRVDQFGRRRLLFLGIGLMMLALVLLSISFSVRSCSEHIKNLADCPQDKIILPEPWAMMTLIALMLYVSGYQIGFGPISWLIISEVFPLSVRGSALSTAAMVNFGSNILMNTSQVALMKLLSPSGLFSCYLVFAFASFVFVSRMVPETKGRTLEEIETEMTK
eukprot:TRINITY_DN106853_c0_g1_i1.p1 TRINITY_DN106853_c0_g1~~TRINITY_DN106853_c0_g1_i1.p1  ORF type:complete len:509 (+),score=89.84 TRINITY_DN106853_c0_g1_i1:98-1624(+)